MRAPVLVCFALKDEAKYFHVPKQSEDIRILLTGMGKKNAAASIRRELGRMRPRLVISSGFAGGLNPELKLNAIAFDEDVEAGLNDSLLKLGAKRARFHCAGRVAATAAEKLALRQSTGADAVEMESSIIRAICREEKIPSATIRVISDVAREDLPLDFNQLTTPDLQLSYARLAGTLLRHPGKIPQLMRFQKQAAAAAETLGVLLSKLLRDGRG